MVPSVVAHPYSTLSLISIKTILSSSVIKKSHPNTSKAFVDCSSMKIRLRLSIKLYKPNTDSIMDLNLSTIPIKANKFDRTYLYSKIVMIKELAPVSKIEIFPNPVLEKIIYIKYDLSSYSDGILEIYNTNGELMFSKFLLFSKNQQLQILQTNIH